MPVALEPSGVAKGSTGCVSVNSCIRGMAQAYVYRGRVMEERLAQNCLLSRSGGVNRLYDPDHRRSVFSSINSELKGNLV